MLEQSHDSIDQQSNKPELHIDYMKNFLDNQRNIIEIGKILEKQMPGHKKDTSIQHENEDKEKNIPTLQTLKEWSNTSFSLGALTEKIGNQKESYKKIFDEAINDIVSDESSMIRAVITGRSKEFFQPEDKSYLEVLLKLYHIVHNIDIGNDNPSLDDLKNSICTNIMITHPEFTEEAKRTESTKKKIEQQEEYTLKPGDIACYKGKIFKLNEQNKREQYDIPLAYIPPKEGYEIYEQTGYYYHHLCNTMKIYIDDIIPKLSPQQQQKYKGLLDQTIMTLGVQSIYMSKLSKELGQSTNPEEYKNKKEKITQAKKEQDDYVQVLKDFAKSNKNDLKTGDIWRTVEKILDNPLADISTMRHELANSMIRSSIDATSTGLFGGDGTDEAAKQILEGGSTGTIKSIEYLTHNKQIIEYLNSSLKDKDGFFDKIVKSTPDTLYSIVGPQEGRADTYISLGGREISSTQRLESFADIVRQTFPGLDGTDLNARIIMMIKSFKESTKSMSREFKENNKRIDEHLSKETTDDEKRDFIEEYNSSVNPSDYISYSDPVTSSEWSSYITKLKDNIHKNYSKEALQLRSIKTSDYITRYEQAKLSKRIDLNNILQTSGTMISTALDIGTMFIGAGAIANISTGGKIGKRLSKFPSIPRIFAQHLIQAGGFSAGQIAIDGVKGRVKDVDAARNILTSNIGYYAFFLGTNKELLGTLAKGLGTSGNVITKLFDRTLKYLKPGANIPPSAAKDIVATAYFSSMLKKMPSGGDTQKFIADTLRIMGANGSGFGFDKNGDIVLGPTLTGLASIIQQPPVGGTTFTHQDVLNSLSIAFFTSNSGPLNLDNALSDRITNTKYGLVIKNGLMIKK